MYSNKFDVVIIGAGIAGIATAYYLATQQGVTNILLVDKRPPMTYTSDKSGSNYRNWWPHPSMMALANHSIDMMDQLSQATHNIFNLNRRGYAYFSRHQHMLENLEHYQNPLMGEIRIHEKPHVTYEPAEDPRLNGADILRGNAVIRQVMPFVSDDIEALIHVRRAGWVSTRVMAHHMLDTATQLGLVELRGEVTHLTIGEGLQTLNVMTEYGEQTVKASHVVLCTGPELGTFQEVLGWDISLENVFHQKVMIRDNGEILPDKLPFMIFRDAPISAWTDEELLYLRHHFEGEKVPGNFHIRRVNDTWIHVGWAFNNRSTNDLPTTQLDAMFPKVAVKGMASFIPALQEYAETIPEPFQVSGGFYTRTQENLPIVQQVQSGVFVIGALSGFGVMMGCGVGEIMSRLITEQPTPEYIEDFNVNRYNNPDYLERMRLYGSGEL